MQKHYGKPLAYICTAAVAGGLLLPTTATAAPGADSRGELDGLSGREVAGRALKELGDVDSLHMRLDASEVKADLALDGTGNCAGHVRLAAQGAVDVVKRGGTVWLKPDAKFWKQQIGGEKGAEAAEAFKDRYIKGGASDAMLGGLSTACDLDALRATAGTNESGRDAAGWKRGRGADHDGKDTVTVARSKGGAKVTMLVSAEGTPYPVRLLREAGGSAPGASDQEDLRFDAFDRPVPKKTPGKRETVTVDEVRDQLNAPPATEV
ncbi:hypothetical protein [Streptomyces sulphureus]|uniref:hypothetical protein n=1 Tax=Streptomyces sulphureus TaxID=47758 RepID=UPI0003681158|nr:hypothetical protein [Streptomyces sulphureus]